MNQLFKIDKAPPTSEEIAQKRQIIENLMAHRKRYLVALRIICWVLILLDAFTIYRLGGGGFKLSSALPVGSNATVNLGYIIILFIISVIACIALIVFSCKQRNLHKILFNQAISDSKWKRTSS
jgi:Flp pilus assembly protein protease CpaA